MCFFYKIQRKIKTVYTGESQISHGNLDPLAIQTEITYDDNYIFNKYELVLKNQIWYYCIFCWQNWISLAAIYVRETLTFTRHLPNDVNDILVKTDISWRVLLVCNS